jgi:carboxyl-terminal processing protease
VIVLRRLLGRIKAAAASRLAPVRRVPRRVLRRARPVRPPSARAVAILGLGLLLALLSLTLPGTARPARAAPELPATVPGFNQAQITNVLATALTFLLPRTLDAYTPQQLTLWGLNGLAAIDPSLVVDASGTSVRLSTPHGLLLEAPAPAPADIPGWARLAASFGQAAWSNSAAIRDGGAQAVTQSFFDELFNHLDPYSRYVAPEPAVTDRASRSGGEAGAGITVARDGRFITIETVNANGPAWAAGLSPGMRLLAVNSQSTRNQDPATVDGWLHGPAGTDVTLTVAPANGRGAASGVTVQRAAVPPETVSAFSNGDVVVLRVTGFSADTAQEMSQFIDQATQDTPDGHPSRLRGLIFDLRGNRGGLLQQAVTSVALVLDHGVAVVTKGRDPQANHVWAVQGGDLTDGVPIVVLVDGRTASAAEIMAAALADHRRAVVVGSTTLGKGLVQTIAQLPDGGELFVTWSRVLAPLGWPLQGLGVMPQVCTSLGRDALLQQLHDLGTGTAPLRRAVQDSRAARPPLPASRILELRAPCPAAVGSDMDLDAARALIANHVAYKAALVPQTDVSASTDVE